MKKRLSGILLSLTLMMGMMLVLGLGRTAYADDESPFGLWVGGIAVTDENKGNVMSDGTVSFTPAEGGGAATLTLSGASITEGYTDSDGLLNGIYYNGSDGLNIVLDGTNSITGPFSGSFGKGIQSTGNSDITVSGDGTLITNGSNSDIYIKGGLLTIKSGTVNIEDNKIGIGVAGGDIMISGGTVNAGGNDYGIITEEGDITISGGTVNAGGKYYGIGASGGDITISGGTVNAGSEDHYGIGTDPNCKLTIRGGAVTASGMEGAIYEETVVKNAISGIGWDNTEGTGQGAPIKANYNNKMTFKKVQFLNPAELIMNLINDIPADPTTEKGRAAVKAAREAYDKLTDDQKDQIKVSILKKLTDAEAAIDQADLTTKKNTAKTDLAAYRKAKADSAYDDAGRAALDAARAAGDKAIDKAKDTEAVAEALANAKAALDAVRTKSSTADPTAVGTVHGVASSIGKYVVTSSKTVSLIKAPNRASYTIPATVKISGKTFKVTGINAKAFKGTKVKTLTVKTKKLTKKSVKASLKSSKIKTVKVSVGKKKVNRQYVKKYKKIFTKKNAGRKVKIIS